jgi:SRSO17 transposase
MTYDVNVNGNVVDIASRGIAELTRLCQDLFSSFTRSDQRRWGELYVRGLVTVPGRKSIRRISDHIVGWSAEQCLQQFVNQSPWEWEPVRCRLARRVGAELRPRAWLVEEVVFPKNGASSVGVAKQYSYSAGRMLNCQLGLTVSMAGDAGCCPVNWRLLLPRCWNDDAPRRTRAHLPEHEQHRSRWQHLVDALDEMAVDWDLPPVPVLLDARQDHEVEPLLRGLEERGLRYLVQVAENTPAVDLPALPRPQTVGEVVARSARRDGMTLSLRDGTDGRLVRSQFVTVPLPGLPGQRVPGGTAATPSRGPRRVLAEWSPGRRRSTAMWLTNLNAARLPDLIELIRLRRRAGDQLHRFGEDCGLQHFEGRSYRGWHHHVTLASVAHAHRLLGELAERERADLRPYA